MKYLIVGTGGTGGAIGGFLASAGYDVTFIARGRHLERMKERGLIIRSAIKGDMTIPDIKCSEAENYSEKADVIFICVKSYSIDDILLLIKKASHKETVIIPILNGIGVGDKLYEKFKEAYIVDGCIYIVAYLEAPGVIVQSSSVLKVVFGERSNQSCPKEKLERVKSDLCSSGITGIVSDNIVRDTFQKFSFISPYASCGVYYGITAKEMRETLEYRNMFIELVREIKSIADAMKISFDADILEASLKLLDSVAPDTTASLQKDVDSGRQTEMDGLIFEVVRLAEKYRVEVPNYRRIVSIGTGQICHKI